MSEKCENCEPRQSDIVKDKILKLNVDILGISELRQNWNGLLHIEEHQMF